MSRVFPGALLLAAAMISPSAGVEIVNESDKTVYVCVHVHRADNAGANFELLDRYWQSEGWWSVKPGKSVTLFGGTEGATCWMRLTFDSSKGKVIKPAKAAGGPASLPVHHQAFKIRRTGEDKDDTWFLTIDGKMVSPPGRGGFLKVTSAEAVKNHGCWIAEGFYGYKPDVKFTVK